MAVSQPNIHRCLKVSELVSMICDRIEEKPDLLHLALTCRHFCPASLNSLWADTRLGIVALLRCLPEDVIQVHGEPGGNTGPVPVTLNRLPTLEEWDRVRFYSFRMRNLSICRIYQRQLVLAAGCYRLFLDRWPYHAQHIFPQVRTIELEVPFPPGIMFFSAIARSLISPLSELQLVLKPHHNHEPFLYGSLDICAGALTSFQVHSWLFYPGDDDDADLLTQTADYVGNAFIACSALQSVYTYLPLSSTAMMHLAHLTNLTNLTFAFHANYRSPQLLEPHPENFRSLRTLDITMYERAELEGLCVFLANLRSPALNTLSITFSLEPLVTRLLDLVRTIARLGSLRSLRLGGNARFALHTWQPKDPDEWPIQCSQMLDALAPLRHLRELNVVGLPLHVTGSDIARVGNAWPGLEVLDLSAEEEFTSTSVDAAALRVLAAACPRLRKVQLQVIGGDGGDVSDQYSHVEALGLYMHGDPRKELGAGVVDALLHMFPHAKISYVDMADVQKRPLEEYGVSS